MNVFLFLERFSSRIKVTALPGDVSRFLFSRSVSGGGKDSNIRRMKNTVPDRWTNYSSIGRRMEGTRFIAFKVPLCEALLRKVPDHLQFGPMHLMFEIERQRLKLGLVIDLTNTSRYYDHQEFLHAGIDYMKIYTAGKSVPNQDVIDQFSETVKYFLGNNIENDKLIGVHCTHGVNRTGYLLCRYLIDFEHLDPEAVIYAFSAARGHPIERPNYLHDLRSVHKRCESAASRGHWAPHWSNPVQRVGEMRKAGQAHNESPLMTQSALGLANALDRRISHQQAQKRVDEEEATSNNNPFIVVKKKKRRHPPPLFFQRRNKP
uniref:RNA/RNP complex-1-interacting phosphatase isoform X2 n=1 Tax=Myxine glutinosa TaxID=7769 RepID=UPI00358FA277